MNKRIILRIIIVLIFCLIVFSTWYLPNDFFFIDYHPNQATFFGNAMSELIVFFTFWGIINFAESITNFFIEKQEE